MPIETQAYVICLNDFPKHVVLGDSVAARERMSAVKEAYFQRQPLIWGGKTEKEHRVGYEQRCHWSITFVPCTPD